ncbi:hypothetical protein [Zavarzinia sp. CC-PAN008]|uniref:hypothetical protein n=1 Tax=Zavarzinia sp. CC-PAN008 TaxID=3243332 RepID=UPI003F743465
MSYGRALLAIAAQCRVRKDNVQRARDLLAKRPESLPDEDRRLADALARQLDADQALGRVLHETPAPQGNLLWHDRADLR